MAETADIKSLRRPPGQLAAVESRAADSYNAIAKMPIAPGAPARLDCRTPNKLIIEP
jgi:hypothetical protein